MASKIQEAIRAELVRLGGPVYEGPDHLMIAVHRQSDPTNTVRMLMIAADDARREVHLRLPVAPVPLARAAVVREHLDQLNGRYAFQRWTLEEGEVVLTWELDFLDESSVKVVMWQFGRMLHADERHRPEILQLLQQRRGRRPRVERQAEHIIKSLQ